MANAGSLQIFLNAPGPRVCSHSPARRRGLSSRGLRNSPVFVADCARSDENETVNEADQNGDVSVVSTTSVPDAEGQRVARRSSLRGSPLSCGVKNATSRFDLPKAPVAVRNLVEQANFAHLCTIMSNMHHRRAGYPFGTLVDFTADGAGFPIFSLSPLAIPTRNLLEDSRCSLVVQMPGWTGLANARVTIFGDVYQLPPEMHQAARELFQLKHVKKENFLTGNCLYFRMHHIKDIYFVGGFGTVQWIDVPDYIAARPDEIAQRNPTHTLRVLNDMFASDIKKLFTTEDQIIDDAAIISIDAIGADIRVRTGPDFGVLRIGFADKISTLQDAIRTFQHVINEQSFL